ncbi:MAG TPA: Rpn family recombination-promoting nuclease/putative transposase [Candidatus Coprosoma intestinipullorum]|uniref:Rpn family recombination-promoting nuclease/putative transposase n=1 Tax=Candidatus Coprosoma intestinipullorum TaxID=2840752 RepID=A0A9D1CYY0_9FIRM|nr:Rpn family recombination-promoting nuclease/putative transposase [Candidatus Coprosoma intestinipullorum]
MKKIKDEVNRVNDENYFANFISVEEDERKIRNTYYANGVEEGEARGEKRGEIRGEIRGEKRGKEKALLETAKNLLKYGMPINDIVKNTGLSKQKIKSLQ